MVPKNGTKNSICSVYIFHYGSKSRKFGQNFSFQIALVSWSESPKLYLSNESLLLKEHFFWKFCKTKYSKNAYKFYKKLIIHFGKEKLVRDIQNDTFCIRQ